MPQERPSITVLCRRDYSSTLKECHAMRLLQQARLGCICDAVHPEHVVDAVRHHYDKTSHPSNLHLYTVAAVGDGKGRGLARLAAAGLVTKYTYGW